MKIWERKDKPSKFSRIVSSVKKPEPLKERISFTVYKLKAQEGRLEQSYQRMQSHYNEIFRKCTNAVLAKDSARSSIYANECAEIRKMARIVLGSKIALERAVLRLETVEQFGDVLMQISPVIGVVKETSGKIEGVEVALSIASGEGREHMALISALLSIPVGVRFTALTKEGIIFF